MAYAKIILLVLAGCVSGGVALYALDRCIDAIFARAWETVGGFAPLFSLWQYLFTGLGGILLGGITFWLMARPQVRSLALVYICAGYSIGIIAFGMPSSALFVHSGQNTGAKVIAPSPFSQVVQPSEDDVHNAERLLLRLYWATPLVWSLALFGCLGARVWRSERLPA
jgi:ABC-type branched-subunit amino acid transport system permease subunit